MIILTRNFFNVARTAIQESSWKGSEAKNVHLALRELDRLEELNMANQQERQAEVAPTPVAGDIEYYEEKEPENIDIPDDVLPVEED